MTKSGKLDAFARRQPLEVEHRVDGLDLNPIAPIFQSVSDQIRIISVAHDKLVAVIYVCIFKWDFILDGCFLGIRRIVLLSVSGGERRCDVFEGSLMFDWVDAIFTCHNLTIRFRHLLVACLMLT